MKYFEIALLLVPFLCVFLAKKGITSSKVLINLYRACSGCWAGLVLYSWLINVGALHNLIPTSSSLVIGHAFNNTLISVVGVALYIVTLDYLTYNLRTNNTE